MKKQTPPTKKIPIEDLKEFDFFMSPGQRYFRQAFIIRQLTEDHIIEKHKNHFLIILSDCRQLIVSPGTELICPR